MQASETLGPYQLLERIGEGGFADVFRAREASGTTEVALKRFRAPLPDLEAARRLLALDHPAVVRVLDVGRWTQTDGSSVDYLTMELVDGPDLRQLARAGKSAGAFIGVNESLYVVAQLLSGLHHAHELGLVHRDVSPANVFVSRRGDIKLGDFDLGLRATAPDMLLGREGYLSPEAARGEAVDRRADLFAVGVLTWELLSGRRVYGDAAGAQLIERAAAADIAPIESVVGADPTLAAWVGTLLRSDASERFSTAKAALAALDGLGDPASRASSQARLGERVGALFPAGPRRATLVPTHRTTPEGPPQVKTVQLAAPPPAAVTVTLTQPGGPPTGGDVDDPAGELAPLEGPKTDVMSVPLAPDVEPAELHSQSTMMLEAPKSMHTASTMMLEAPKSMHTAATMMLEAPKAPSTVAPVVTAQLPSAPSMATQPPMAAPKLAPPAAPLGGAFAAGPPPPAPPPPPAKAPVPAATMALPAPTGPVAHERMSSPTGEVEPIRPPSTWGRWVAGPLLAGVVCALTMVASEAVLPAHPPPPPPKPRGHVLLRTDPAGAMVTIDGKPFPHFTPTSVEGEVGATLRVGLTAHGFEGKAVEVYVGEGEHTMSVKLEKTEPAPAASVAPTVAASGSSAGAGTKPRGGIGRVSVFVRPWAIVYVDGARLRQTPIEQLELPAGHHTIELVNDARGKRERIQLNVESGGVESIRRDWD